MLLWQSKRGIIKENRVEPPVLSRHILWRHSSKKSWKFSHTFFKNEDILELVTRYTCSMSCRSTWLVKFLHLNELVKSPIHMIRLFINLFFCFRQMKSWIVLYWHKNTTFNLIKSRTETCMCPRIQLFILLSIQLNGKLKQNLPTDISWSCPFAN